MSAPAEATLIFNWGPPRRRARALLVFIIVSLMLHAFCFYLFQIVYPPAIALAPPPARVALITNQTEDGRSLLRWIDAEDPALIAATLRPPNSRARDLPRVEHVPSYKLERPQLKPLPPLVVDLRPPSPQPVGPVPTMHRPAPLKPVKRPSGLTFSEELAAVGPATSPPASFRASNNDQPENVRFRVAVNAMGEVQYEFPLNSSGDPALDLQARHQIALTRFPARPSSPNEPLIWGIATMEWGTDVTRPAPPTSASPAP